jgi:outer membrane protein assembly factor BamE
MKRLALPTISLALGALLASGCVYKMNIQQGNYLVPDSVSQLKEGMTRSQVRFLLGTPMVPDAFDDTGGITTTSSARRSSRSRSSAA